MVTSRWFGGLAVLLLLTAGAMPAAAQLTTGSVAGTVKDEQGGVIPGATVTLINEARGTKSTPAVTSATGDFTFANVTADTYTVEVAMPSFKTSRQTGITVSPGTRATVAVVLQLGGQSEVVDVQAEAALIQATSGERSFTVTTESVANLPIANRGFSDPRGARARRG